MSTKLLPITVGLLLLASVLAFVPIGHAAGFSLEYDVRATHKGDGWPDVMMLLQLSGDGNSGKLSGTVKITRFDKSVLAEEDVVGKYDDKGSGSIFIESKSPSSFVSLNGVYSGADLEVNEGASYLKLDVSDPNYKGEYYFNDSYDYGNDKDAPDATIGDGSGGKSGGNNGGSKGGAGNGNSGGGNSGSSSSSTGAAGGTVKATLSEALQSFLDLEDELKPLNLGAFDDVVNKYLATLSDISDDGNHLYIKEQDQTRKGEEVLKFAGDAAAKIQGNFLDPKFDPPLDSSTRQTLEDIKGKLTYAVQKAAYVLLTELEAKDLIAKQKEELDLGSQFISDAVSKSKASEKIDYYVKAWIQGLKVLEYSGIKEGLADGNRLP